MQLNSYTHSLISSNILKNKKIASDGLIFILYGFVALTMCYLQPKESFITSVFYSLVILFAVLFSAFAQRSKNSITFKINYSLSFLILFFILGFRNYSGIDDPSYISIFNEVAQVGWIEKFRTSTMEPGYLFLNYVVSIFTDNYLYMQLVSAFIPLYLFYFTFNKYKSVINLPSAIFLFCCLIYFQMLSVSLIRMFIAISIVFCAYSYILQKKTLKYVGLILIASLFHYSAFFAIIFTYFSLDKQYLQRKAVRFIIVLFLLIPIIYISVSKFLVPLLGARYSAYGTIGNLHINITNFDTIPFVFLLLLYLRKFNDGEKHYYKLFMVIFSFSSIISFYSSMVSFGRLVFYTNVALFIAAPMVIGKIKNNLIFNGLIVLYGFIYVYWTQFTLKSNIPHLFPYQNIFFSF